MNCFLIWFIFPHFTFLFTQRPRATSLDDGARKSTRMRGRPSSALLKYVVHIRQKFMYFPLVANCWANYKDQIIFPVSVPMVYLWYSIHDDKVYFLLVLYKYYPLTWSSSCCFYCSQEDLIALTQWPGESSGYFFLTFFLIFLSVVTQVLTVY